MGRLAQRRDVAGGNEAAVRGQVTAANDWMCGGLAAADRPVHFRPTWSASCFDSAPNCMLGPLQRAELSSA
jgi:hypothetical protein